MAEDWPDRLFRTLFDGAPDALIVVDAAGTIVLANAQAETLFGYPISEMDGKSLELLLPERHREQHAGYLLAYFANPQRRPMGRVAELHARRRDGSEFRAEISLSPIFSDGRRLVASAIRDITKRKQIEETTRRTLEEKDALLREIHHRVKNNLAAISSLFYLESTYLEDKRQAEVFMQSRNRVQSMAMVHEALYESDNLAAVDFAQYLRTLTEHLAGVYLASRDDLDVVIELQPTSIAIDQAIPCGLIVNELITNALKHAFRPSHKGRLHVRLSNDQEFCELSIRDDGVGIPEDLDLARSRSLGLRLVRTLSGQLNADIQLRRTNPGSEARLRFKLSSSPDE